MMTLTKVWCLVLLVRTSLDQEVAAHGRLIDPPGRSTMWRYNYSTPINYDDMGLNCGGFQRQWEQNGGKCGVCGDPFDGDRDNEAGGKYATNTIVSTYDESSQIKVEVEITAHHKGYFEFRLCVNDDLDHLVTQECLDNHILRTADTNQTKFPIPTVKNIYTVILQLPSGVVCSRCIFQWKYNTGNSEGRDQLNGSYCMGCGPQEQFYACSDIAIVRSMERDNSGIQSNDNPTTVSVIGLSSTASEIDLDPDELPNTLSPSLSAETTKKQCRSRIHNDQTSDEWCDINCNFRVPFCPSFFCKCYTAKPMKMCRSVMYDDDRLHNWCMDNCNHNPPFCPDSHCICLKNGIDEYTLPPKKECRSLISNNENYHKWCVDNCNHNPPYCPKLFCNCSDGDGDNYSSSTQNIRGSTHPNNVESETSLYPVPTSDSVKTSSSKVTQKSTTNIMGTTTERGISFRSERSSPLMPSTTQSTFQPRKSTESLSSAILSTSITRGTGSSAMEPSTAPNTFQTKQYTEESLFSEVDIGSITQDTGSSAMGPSTAPNTFQTKKSTEESLSSPDFARSFTQNTGASSNGLSTTPNIFQTKKFTEESQFSPSVHETATPNADFSSKGISIRSTSQTGKPTVDSPSFTTPSTTMIQNTGSSSMLLQVTPSGCISIEGDMDEWCQTNCNHNPPFCPTSYCVCP